jgi:uncharacterized membrane protein
MTTETLTTVVVGYTTTSTALEDFHDLERAFKEHGHAAYDAAVVERAPDSSYKVVATTVSPRNENTLRAAGLGAVVGVVFAPALAVAAAGTVAAALIGNVMDRFNALSDADMAETHRLVDESAANLIVITDTEHAQQVESVAKSRVGRSVIPFAPADVDALRRELQGERWVTG